MKRIGPCVVLTSLAIATMLAAAAPQQPELRVPVAPAAVVVDGAAELVYELHIQNPFPDQIALRRVVVVDPANGLTLASFDGDALNRRLGQTANTTADDRNVVPPESSAPLYIEFRQQARAASRSLHHRLEYTRLPASPTPIEVAEGGDVVVRPDAPVVLGAPLRGGPWAAVYSPDWERGHRRVFFAIDGPPRIPGRFAIDWIKVDADGRTAKDDVDRDVVANAFGYGEDVLAVADALVASTRDDVSEEQRVSKRRKHAVQDASGNYVALDLGKSRFAFYEHLKPGSVRVKAGDSVRRGQVIARLGFTGDSTGPHLHLHVSDANSPLAAEGLPFVLDRFDVVGAYRDIADLGKRKWSMASGAAARQKERPAPNVVVNFPAR